MPVSSTIASSTESLNAWQKDWAEQFGQSAPLTSREKQLQALRYESISLRNWSLLKAAARVDALAARLEQISDDEYTTVLDRLAVMAQAASQLNVGGDSPGDNASRAEVFKNAGRPVGGPGSTVGFFNPDLPGPSAYENHKKRVGAKANAFCLSVFHQEQTAFDIKELRSFDLKQIDLDNRPKWNAPSDDYRLGYVGDSNTGAYNPKGHANLSDGDAAVRAQHQLGSKLTEGTVAELMAQFPLSPAIATILKRYNQQAALDKSLMLYNELSEAKAFQLYREDMHASGFSFFKKVGLGGTKKRMVYVLPEISVPELTTGMTNQSHISFAFPRLMKDIIVAGFAAMLKNSQVQEIEIIAWGVVNPFLNDRLTSLGFEKVGERDISSKMGSLGTGFDYSLGLKKR